MNEKTSPRFLGCDATYESADVVLVGVPFDGTTSFRPGARFGPSAMRADSVGLETYSPYCDRDLNDIAVCDVGDLELPFGNARQMLSVVESETENILADGKSPLLGGEHLITLGALCAVAKVHPNLHLIHFDAHTDLRDEYMGETLTHAGVVKQAWHLLGDDRIRQFGIRSGEREEFAFGRAHGSLHPFTLDAFRDAVVELAGVPSIT